MTRKRVEGYCLLDSKDTAYHLQRDQFERVRQAWLKGAQFVDTVGIQGERMTLKLANVDAVVDMTPEAVMGFIEEKRMDEADDSLAGGCV